MSHGINDTRRWGNIFKLTTPITDNLGLEAGIWFNKNDTTHDSQFISSTTGQYLGSVYDEPVETKLYEPYFNLTFKPTDRLTLQGGLKYLKTDRDFIDYAAVAKSKGTAGQYSSSFSTTMPSIGVNYKAAQGINIYANYTRNSNPPQYNQFYTGVYNPDLAPQKATTYDAGVIYDFGMWSGGVDVFRVNFDNYIQSFTYTPPGSTQSISILANVGKAVNEGIAWQNNFQIDKNWSAYANLGLLNAQFTSAKVPMPYSPHSTLALGGIYTVGPWRAKLGVRHASEAYWTDFKSPIPAHTMTDASVRYTWKGGDTARGLGLQKISVGFNVNNLFDKRYITKYNTGYPGSASNPLIKYNLPRSYYLSLEAQF